jgi:hypothetical protein
MKTTARFTLADIVRATRAAKEQGAAAVDVLPDGTIRIRILLANDEATSAADQPPKPVRDFKL